MAINHQQEAFNLDIDKGNSVFYSAVMAIKDSLMREGIKGRVEPKLDYYIEYNQGEKELFFTEFIGITAYRVEEKREINWKLVESSIDSLYGFRVQKAKTNFSGRNWTAWYTSEIPYSEGPYKFKGLPGLILKLEDDDMDYQFEFLGMKKTEQSYDLSIPYVKKIDLKFDEYLKVMKEIERNPRKIEYLVMGENTFTKNINRQLGKVLAEAYISLRKRNNNPIELL